MRPIIIGAIVVKDPTSDQAENHRVIVATKLKYNSPQWTSKQLNCLGWPPDYFFETAAKNGRKNNATEAQIYFGSVLPMNDFIEEKY